jgi:predicted NBD/HSP70 family sugar kinase
MAVPNDLRQMNRRQAVLALLRTGVSTRPDIARETGLSLPTTVKIIDELSAAGVIRSFEQPAETARPGRPSRLLKLDDLVPKFLAVQLGPVNTRLAVLPVAPSVAGDNWAKVIPTPPSLNRWTTAATKAAQSLLTFEASAVLVSVPGVLDEETGRTLLSPNARWMEGEAVAARFGDALGVPVFAVQEIRCLALGHALTHPDAGDFLLVDFGIGVGSAAMIGGQLLRGQLPFTGELGHTPVPGNTAKCGCGGVGCLETLVGRRQLLGEVSEDADKLSAPEVKKLTAGQKSGQLLAAMRAAGLGVAGAMNVLGLNRVVLTGFVADLPENVFNVLRDVVTAAAVAGRFGPVRVETARRHRLAGLASVGIDRVIAPPG